MPLIHERFARLGVIANLLRDDEQRKRCASSRRPACADVVDDHWRKVGVPKWRGTGCACCLVAGAVDQADYYSRYRPGLPLVLLGITLATCVFQYAAQWLSRIGDVGRVNECVPAARFAAELCSLRDRARTAAYGAGEAAASATERKRVRIPMRAGDDEMPRKNRPMLTVVVEGQQMTAVYDDGAEVPLDSRSVPKPQLLATWVPALLRALAGRVVSRQLPAAPAAIEELAPPYELAPPPRTASPAGGVQRRKGQPRRK